MKNLILTTLFICLSTFAQIEPIDEIIAPTGDFDSSKFTKVAVVQWASNYSAPLGNTEAADKYKKQNISVLESYIREAAANGAKYVVTPEFGILGYPDIPDLPSEDDNFRNRDDIKPYVETVPGPATEYFSQMAKELGIYIQFGLAERDIETDLYYNTAVAISPEGEIVGKYRKQHLYKIEENFLATGDQNVSFNTPFGKVGLIICSDIYDDKVMNKYKEMQVNVLSLSTSWADYNSGWRYFTKAATWVNAYIFAANHNYFPDSGIINPDGSTQSHIRQSDGVAYGFVKNL